jgi:hypothetical protein
MESPGTITLEVGSLAAAIGKTIGKLTAVMAPRVLPRPVSQTSSWYGRPRRQDQHDANLDWDA